MEESVEREIGRREREVGEKANRFLSLLPREVLKFNFLISDGEIWLGVAS